MTPDDSAWVQSVLGMHAHKLASVANSGSLERGVYLLHALGTERVIPIHAAFVHYSREDAAEALNTERRSVQWLLRNQIPSYNVDDCILAGVLFESGEVLTHELALRRRAPPSVSGS